VTVGVLHLLAGEKLVCDNHSLKIRSEIVLKLDKQEEPDADDGQQRDEASSVGSLRDIGWDFLEDVQLSHLVP